MLRVWVHGWDPGRVSDGSRLALCHECPSSIFFWHVYFVIILVPFSLSFLFLFVFVVSSKCRQITGIF